MNKTEQKAIEETTVYRIIKDFGKNSNTYRIDKIVATLPMDTYHVSIVQPNGQRPGTLWCDCPGFRRQTYAKEQHKHVVLAMDYIERGCPDWADYHIKGQGKKAKVKFHRSSEDA